MHQRSREAFLPSADGRDRLDALRALVHRDVYEPTEEEVEASVPAVADAVGAGRIKVLIPLRDAAPVAAGIVRAVTRELGAENVFVSDNGLHPDVGAAIAGAGATIVSVEATKRRCDLPRLLDVLALDRLEFGLGMSVWFAMAHFALESIARPDDWVVKLDGDVANFEESRLLHYLLHPLAAGPRRRWDHLRIAKVGRNNEGVLAAVNGLAAWLHGAPAAGAEQDERAVVAREIYESCIRQQWLLCGQYATRWMQARRQLGATGYSDALLVAIQNGRLDLAQTIHPQPLLDMANTKRKEDCMVTRIVQLLNGLVAFGRPLGGGWDMDQVACFNRDVARHLSHVVWIPERAAPSRSRASSPTGSSPRSTRCSRKACSARAGARASLPNQRHKKTLRIASGGKRRTPRPIRAKINKQTELIIAPCILLKITIELGNMACRSFPLRRVDLCSSIVALWCVEYVEQ